MTSLDQHELDQLLRSFRRHVIMSTGLRIAMFVLLGIGLMVSMSMPQESSRRMTMAVLGVGLMLVVLAAMGTLKMTRDVQAGNLLLNRGKLAEAAASLRRAIGRFSFSSQGRFIAVQQFGILLQQQHAYGEVVRLCREMLRYRLKRWRSVCFSVRVMLADSLLMMNREAEAYDAMRPVFDQPMSLLERIRILPVQLRYELASDNAASAVKDLPEKAKLAELMDGPRASLVHALLAEACERQAMTEERDYLLQKAWLYHDVTKLAERYGILAPMASLSQQGDLDRLKEEAMSRPAEESVSQPGTEDSAATGDSSPSRDSEIDQRA